MHPACGWIHSPDAHNCHCFAKNEVVESLGKERLVQRGRGRALEAVPWSRVSESVEFSREKKKSGKNVRISDSPTFQQYVAFSQPGC